MDEQQNALSCRVHALQEAVKVVVEAVLTPAASIRHAMVEPSIKEIGDRILVLAKEFEFYLATGNVES